MIRSPVAEAGPFRPAGYRGAGAARLWAPGMPAAALALGLVCGLALMCGGCSMSYQFDNIFAKADKDGPATTGSIAQPAPEMPPEADLVYARRAAHDVLARGGKDISVPWENPRTGAHGTVTPLGTDYRAQGLVCRDFLASHVTASREAWMQGEACRSSASRSAAWDIRSLKLWRRT